VLILLPLAAFFFVSLLILAAGMALASPAAVAIERRLGEVAPRIKPAGDARAQVAVLSAFKRLGDVAPKRDSETGTLQQRLVTAGYRQRDALVVFLGMRVSFAVLCFLFAMSGLITRPGLILGLVFCAVGFVVPGIVLARVAKRRQRRIQVGLPDALDLLVVSVEAGLGLDQAIQRVSEELAFAHPDLCDELRLINLELRAGNPRADAMQNLARRTALDDVSSLVTMLVQTDKFGTSVAQSLRVHSETLRTKRRQRAEEAAAKTGAKMVFPLALCIFPAILIVTLGPAGIRFVQVLLPMSQQ
jgi:tight adherence protein C